MQPIVLFDGVCNLCNGFIRFMVRFDSEGIFKYAPLQSEIGQELQEKFSLDPDTVDTVVLIEDDEYYEKSTAVFRILRKLDGLWFLFYPLIFLPQSLRDFFYELVAKYRYQVFGKKDECPTPDPEIRDRFLDRKLE